jgi:hypothetical protein
VTERKPLRAGNDRAREPVDTVNFPLTPASNRSRQPRIATRCAVQASWFVV